MLKKGDGGRLGANSVQLRLQFFQRLPYQIKQEAGINQMLYVKIKE